MTKIGVDNVYRITLVDRETNEIVFESEVGNFEMVKTPQQIKEQMLKLKKDFDLMCRDSSSCKSCGLCRSIIGRYNLSEFLQEFEEKFKEK